MSLGYKSEAGSPSCPVTLWQQYFWAWRSLACDFTEQGLMDISEA